jgi:hypothetical protein
VASTATESLRTAKAPDARNAAQLRKALAILVALIVGGFVAVGCSSYRMDAPERTFSLPNDTSGPRLVRRCDWVDDCRSPGEGRLVQLGKAFAFDIYADEERAYVVASAEGKTFGCIKVYVADGRGGDPESLSDLTPCPRGTPETS